jgi:hypothetical protein
MSLAVVIDSNLLGNGSVATEKSSEAPQLPNANGAGSDVVAGQNRIEPTREVQVGREETAKYQDGLRASADKLNDKGLEEETAKKGGSKLTDEAPAVPVVATAGALGGLPNGEKQDLVAEGKGLLDMALGGKGENAVHKGVAAQLDRLHQMEGSLPLDGAGSRVVQTINEAENANNLTPRDVSKLAASVANLVDVQVASNQVVPPAFDLSSIPGFEKVKGMISGVQDMPAGTGAGDLTAMNISGPAADHVNQFREQKAREEQQAMQSLPPLSAV